MLSKSTFQHLRIGFSYFLLPVFLFAISQSGIYSTYKACIVFIVWHILIYPASNSYNSYFDNDEQSIALIKNPLPIKKELYNFSLLLDVLGIALALFVNLGFAFCVVLYGVISKLYSHPKPRLKKYPWISFFVVALFQGAFVYWSTVYAISNISLTNLINFDFLRAGLVCSCLIGSSYPLTQIYQYDEDSKRGDKTLSMLLGKHGSFLFSGMLFISGISGLSQLFSGIQEIYKFYLFLAFCIPVISYFLYWYIQVWRDETKANFNNAMMMTFISSTCMNGYFALLCYLK